MAVCIPQRARCVILSPRPCGNSALPVEQHYVPCSGALVLVSPHQSCGTAAVLNDLCSWAAASLLSGYAWSLDTFVDYCWGDLTNLSIIIVVLLVVEVRSSRTANKPAPHLAARDRMLA